MELTDKVALLTGGATGLGFAYARELVRNGVKNLAILDLATSVGKESVEKLNTEFGERRVIFIPCDVTNQKQFEAGFAETIAKFGKLDIVINNAGILNESNYELMIDINYTAVVRGTLLGLHHMRKDNGGQGGVIVNVASIFGVDPMPYSPIYDGTKHAVVGLSRSLGLPYHYEKTDVRVLTICPGISETPLLSNINPQQFLDFLDIEDVFVRLKTEYSIQKVDTVAEGMVKIIRSAKSGTVWVAESNEPIYEVSFRDRFTMKKALVVTSFIFNCPIILDAIS